MQGLSCKRKRFLWHFIKRQIPHKWPWAAVTALLETLWLLRIKDQSGNISAKIHPSILFIYLLIYSAALSKLNYTILHFTEFNQFSISQTVGAPEGEENINNEWCSSLLYLLYCSYFCDVEGRIFGFEATYHHSPSHPQSGALIH